MGVRMDTFSIRFGLPDEAGARLLAVALSEYGFTRVDGYPRPDETWSVHAWSVGPDRGTDAWRAMKRAAVTIARPFKGLPIMSSHSRNPPYARLKDYPIMLDRPGVQPPVPVIPAVVTPPKASPSLTPDLVMARRPDLSGLDGIDWSHVKAVASGGLEVPDRVRWLATADTSDDPGGDWPDALHELHELLTNSGDLWEAAVVTVPFLVELAHCTGIAKHRRDLFRWLFFLAARPADDMIAGADYAAVENRPPRAGVESQRAYEAVGAEITGLLATWPLQPPAVRFELARLAGLYSEQGRSVRGEIAALADAYSGTTHEVILQLVLALLDERYDDAIVLAEPTGRWDGGNLAYGWLDAPGITNRISAEHALGRSIAYA